MIYPQLVETRSCEESFFIQNGCEEAMLMTPLRKGNDRSTDTIATRYVIDHATLTQTITGCSLKKALFVCGEWVQFNVLNLVHDPHAALLGPNGDVIAELYTVSFLWRNRDPFAIGHAEVTQWFYFAKDDADAKDQLRHQIQEAPGALMGMRLMSPQGHEIPF